MLPPEHQKFMDRALPVFQRDPRFLGVAASGSWITRTMDEYSDIDLVAVVDPKYYPLEPPERHAFIESLGRLLAAFPGDHVGEPRLTICLYDDPLLHVDVKFIAPDDLEFRIENPVILWERDDALSKIIAQSQPKHPMPDPQWIEDRFWVWVHYATLKLGRGELLEVIGFLAYLQGKVFGPLALVAHGQLPRGVRRIEKFAKSDLPDFVRMIPAYDRESCGKAIEATVEFYLRLRNQAANPPRVLRTDAQHAAVHFLKRVITNAHMPFQVDLRLQSIGL